MKRFLAVAVLLFCGSTVHAKPAAAQCGTSCSDIVDADLKVIGHACVQNPDNRQTCVAHQSGCIMNDCGGSGLILSTRGTALASVEFCGGHVREVRPVAVVKRGQNTQVAAVAESKKPHPLWLDRAAEPDAIQ